LKKLFFPIFISALIIGCNQQGQNGRYTNFDGGVASKDDKVEGPERFADDEIDWDRQINQFTEGGRTFPSSDNINNYLDNLMRGPRNPCEGFEDSYGNLLQGEGKIHPAAFGARKVLASMFQSCKALTTVIDGRTPKLRGVSVVDGGSFKKRKITNTQAYVDSHVILSQLKSDPAYPGESCQDMTKKPPVYGYGSRKWPNKSGVINLHSKGAGVTNSSNAASGIDCSAFISTALGVQGLKVSKDAGPFVDNTTRSFHGLLDRKNSCLKRAEYSADQTVMPGDMINVSRSHIVMIDAVGDDPLAVKKFAKTGNCNSISVKDFDFTYIHSGNVPRNYGPSRVHISAHSGGTMWNNLRLTAVNMCRRLISGKEGAVSTKSLAGNSKFSVIRHQTADPDCISDKRVKLKNEECVDGCLSNKEEDKDESGEA
jgi:hypothetical protein